MVEAKELPTLPNQSSRGRGRTFVQLIQFKHASHQLLLQVTNNQAEPGLKSCICLQVVGLHRLEHCRPGAMGRYDEDEDRQQKRSRVRGERHAVSNEPGIKVRLFDVWGWAEARFEHTGNDYLEQSPVTFPAQRNRVMFVLTSPVASSTKTS